MWFIRGGLWLVPNHLKLLKLEALSMKQVKRILCQILLKLSFQELCAWLWGAAIGCILGSRCSNFFYVLKFDNFVYFFSSKETGNRLCKTASVRWPQLKPISEIYCTESSSCSVKENFRFRYYDYYKTKAADFPCKSKKSTANKLPLKKHMGYSLTSATSKLSNVQLLTSNFKKHSWKRNNWEKKVFYRWKEINTPRRFFFWL